MNDTQWTADEVQGFASKLGDFYTELSPTQKQIFADMLDDGVRGDDEVAGYIANDGTLPASTVVKAVSEYLMTQTEA